MSVEERRVMFDSLWDSGVAVIGEEGAKGWAYWHGASEAVDQGCTSNDEEVEEKEKVILSSESPRDKIWFDIETLRSREQLLRWRPDITKNETEDDCIDADRLVLVDDLTPVLFLIEKQDYFGLIIEFMKFFGVTIPKFCGAEKCKNDNNFCMIDEHQIHNSQFGDSLGESKFTESKCELIRNVLNQSIAHFSGCERVHLVQILFNFEYEVLKQNHATKIPETAESCVFDKARVKSLRKMMKNLMKEPANRNCIVLWIEYAKLELKLGFKTEAENVVKTLIKSQTQTWHSSDKLQDRHDRTTLFSFYVKLLLNISDNTPPMQTRPEKADTSWHKTRAVSVLSSFFSCNGISDDETSIGSVDILRTRRQIHKQITELLKLYLSENSKADSEKLCETTSCFVDCMALFEYSAYNIEMPVVTYTTINEILPTMSEVNQTAPYKANLTITKLKESLITSQINLISHHIVNSIAPLTMLREYLNLALQHYPDNTYFLQVFVDMEMRSFIAGRLRRHFDDAIRNSESLAPIVFAVQAELLRLNIQREQTTLPADTQESSGDTGTVHRLRAIFERVLNRDVFRHCVLLWRLYLQFEMSHGDQKRAAGIFYKSLQFCPWAKVVYKDAIRLFPQKLEEIHDLMTEKELRIHAPLEEINLLIEELGQ